MALSVNSRISLLFLCLLLGFELQAQDSLTFVIKNAGINVDGVFRNHTITQKFDPDKLEEAYFYAAIDINSIDTGIKARDKHLKKSKYFDLENYPKITFKSTSISKNGEEYIIIGALSIKETTRSVEIPFSIAEVNGVDKFKGYLEIDRRDYGVGKNHLVLGDLVRIYLSIEKR